MFVYVRRDSFCRFVCTRVGLVYVDKCVLPDRFGQKFVRAAESQAAGNQGRLPIRTQRGVLQNTKYERLNTIILNETELNITGQNGVWFGCMVCRHHQCQLIHIRRQQKNETNCEQKKYSWMMIDVQCKCAAGLCSWCLPQSRCCPPTLCQSAPSCRPPRERTKVRVHGGIRLIPHIKIQ